VTIWKTVGHALRHPEELQSIIIKDTIERVDTGVVVLKYKRRVIVKNGNKELQTILRVEKSLFKHFNFCYVHVLLNLSIH